MQNAHTKNTAANGLSFQNTAIAFAHKSNDDLKKAQLLFSAFNHKWLLSSGPKLAKLGFSLGLPIKGIIKKTLFSQFCGGESIEDCQAAIKSLTKANIGTILDFSIEGQESEAVFNSTTEEIKRTILSSSQNPDSIPFAVFKVTGIGRFELLAKKSNPNQELAENEAKEFEQLRMRFFSLTTLADELSVRLFVDAEESWIQPCIDELVEEAIVRHNKNRTIIYNTLQMYRHDRLHYLEQQIEKAKTEGFYLGFKIVRGAYMEKERFRAQAKNYPSPIQPNKQATDRDYNAALALCMEHIDIVAICAGTHNEESSMYLTELMKKQNLQSSEKRVYFAQLLGMSDHISFNLSKFGYKVAKYVPYGPVKEVLPYLVRRAEENSSVKGQASRELTLIRLELERRNNKT